MSSQPKSFMREVVDTLFQLVFGLLVLSFLSQNLPGIIKAATESMLRR